jgi:hypothetical protein
LVRAEYVRETVSEGVRSENIENVQEKRSFIHNNDVAKEVVQSKNMKEQEREIGSNLTGIKVVSKKLNKLNNSDNIRFLNSQDKPKKYQESVEGGCNLTDGKLCKEKIDTSIQKNVNMSFLHNKGEKVNAEWRDNETEKFGRKVAGYKAAFESMSSDT